MGQTKGDKARYHRERRKKIARRVKMRALRAALANPNEAKRASPVRGGRGRASALRAPDSAG
jgi:hypothetical protein